MPAVDELTARQKSVVMLVRRGLSNAEIARELRITPDGVKAHLSRLYLRFGVTNRVALIAALDDLGANTYVSNLGELRAISGRARERGRHLATASAEYGPLHTVRTTLAAVDVALEMLRELPPETTGPMLDALRKRVAAAVAALDQTNMSVQATGAS